MRKKKEGVAVECKHVGAWRRKLPSSEEGEFRGIGGIREVVQNAFRGIWLPKGLEGLGPTFPANDSRNFPPYSGTVFRRRRRRRGGERRHGERVGWVGRGGGRVLRLFFFG